MLQIEQYISNSKSYRCLIYGYNLNITYESFKVL